MKTVEDVQRHLTRLQGAVWELAAMTVALRDSGAVDPDQRRAAEQVLVESGLLVESSDGPQPSTGLAERLGAYGPGMAAGPDSNLTSTGMAGRLRGGSDR